MHRKLKLFAALSVLLLTVCTFYDQSGAVISPNGLSCQSQTDIGFFKGQKYAKCYYECSDGTFRELEIPGKFSASSPLYSASKKDVDAQFCGTATQPTTTPLPATLAPTSTLSPTVLPVASPTEPVFVSPTTEISATTQPALLTGEVTMCDLAVDLINFRMNEPIPDLKTKALEVQIAGQDSTCRVNAVNPSLLTCTIPAAETFPARVVVRFDNVIVNDFVYDGLWCANIATPLPTLIP